MLQLVEEVHKRIFLLSPEQIDEHWPNIAKLMVECPGYYDYFTPEWTYSKAKSGDLQIWGMMDDAIRGIIVTQIMVFPAQKVFESLGAAGVGLVEFLDEMDLVFEFIAADAGCSTIMARCRPGLERLLRKRGVFKQAVWLYRPVGKYRRH